MLVQVYDFRNDVLLAEACRSDVGKFCKKVEPGAPPLLRLLQLMPIRGTRGVRGVLAARPSSAEGGTAAGAGEGRVVACLRQHRPKLQAECRKEELQLSLLAASDVRLRPKLRKLCSEEMAVYCAGVKPGAPSVLACACPPSLTLSTGVLQLPEPAVPLLHACASCATPRLPVCLLAANQYRLCYALWDKGRPPPPLCSPCMRPRHPGCTISDAA